MPRPRKAGDYSRVDDALQDIRDEIEFEYGEKYENLDATDQRQVLLDHFFKGLPSYRESAEDMREGLAYQKETGESHVSVSTVRLRGKEHRVIRGSDGRFKQWVKEE
jgi:hypothetical protein